MFTIFEPFGYFVNLKLLGFIFKDTEREWFALTDFKGQFLEHSITFKHIKRKKPQRDGVIIMFNDTPYGTISYLDFDSKTNLTHEQFMPNELKVDMANSFGFSI